MQLISKRKVLFIISLISLIAIIYSLYAEVILHQEPCPLCIVQRVIVLVIGVLALIFALHNPKNMIMRIYGIIILVFCGLGIKTASHHAWLMSLPLNQQPESCGAPLGFLFKHLPLNQFIELVIKGDATCSKITWRIMGLTPPVAVIILCSVLALLSLYVIFAKKPT